MKRRIHYLAGSIILIPFLYLIFVWDQLPETVPTHFGIDGKPDAYGSKWTLGILTLISIAIYISLRYAPRFDPRLKQAHLSEHYPKLILLVIAFLSCTQLLIIRSALGQLAGEVIINIIFAGVFLLLAGIGNYLSTIKSNYFVGIRTPWTLESETVWRKTHQMGGKLLFAVGLVGAAVVVWLPLTWKIVWTMSLIFATVGWLFVYSYRVHREERRNAPQG